jgi:hypothetical protein
VVSGKASLNHVRESSDTGYMKGPNSSGVSCDIQLHQLLTTDYTDDLR